MFSLFPSFFVLYAKYSVVKWKCILKYSIFVQKVDHEMNRIKNMNRQLWSFNNQQNNNRAIYLQ